MAIVPFLQIAGPRAARETRCITASGGHELPAGSYGFIEFYCTDPSCDCRRVILQVRREDAPGRIWATITYGWDTPEYYARWSHCGMGAEADEMASASLELLSPQSKFSGVFLKLFNDVLLRDADYVERLKRHYREACPGRVSGIAPASDPSKRRVRPRRKR